MPSAAPVSSREGGFPDLSPRHIAVHPLTGHIGAEIEAPALSRPLAPEVVDEIRAALLKWKVVFFRDQPLSHAEHVALASAFGAPTIGHPVFGFVEGHPQVYSVGRDRFATRHTGEPLIRPWTGWHTDVTAAVNPPAASILRGVTIPPYGGDTFWTNLAAAYEALSPALRGFVDTLRGIHAFAPPEGQAGDVPVGVDGRPSTIVAGEPLEAFTAGTA